jgi:hypothetical protein
VESGQARPKQTTFNYQWLLVVSCTCNAVLPVVHDQERHNNESFNYWKGVFAGFCYLTMRSFPHLPMEERQILLVYVHETKEHFSTESEHGIF